MKAFAAAAICAAGIWSATSAAAEYRLTLEGTGLREYYCTVTATLTNESDEPLTEINGYFFSYIGDEKVGRSKGQSFLNLAPGESAVATFETPSAPCDEITRYDFVVGACRFEVAFEDRSLCAAKVRPEPPFGGVAGF